jgi:hypothetical protein
VRRTIALLAAAVTSMVAIAFLIPLAIIVRDVARDRALTAAQVAGASVEPVLAVTTARGPLQRAIASTPAGASGRLAVFLAGPVVSGPVVRGPVKQEVGLIIRAARRPAPGEPPACDAAEVLRERMSFWSVLAEDQGRPWHLTGADSPARVPVPRSDLAAAADALIGNVFRHTAEGTGFAVTLHAGHDRVLVFFADGGPGIGDPDAALRRGASGAGSTGLGLDIARRVAQSAGGALRIDRSTLGGAQVQMWLRTSARPARRGRREIRHISS